MRNISELLQILLDNIRYINDEQVKGLCMLCVRLYAWDDINHPECIMLRCYIAEHRPATIKKNGYYWRIGAKAPRIKWLKEQIELNKM